MNYISFIDIIGTKNLANYNTDGYKENVISFQRAIIDHVDALEGKGKIHFFSDCAYIEADSYKALIRFLLAFRNELMIQRIFLKGSLIYGKLGAISRIEDDEKIRGRYGEEIFKKYKAIKPALSKYKNEIDGTLFFSSDIGDAFKYQDNLKGIGHYVQSELLKKHPEMEAVIVDSFYVKETSKKKGLEFIKDLKYERNDLTDNVVDLVVNQYALSNTYSSRYGRYYLTIIASMINSTNFSKIKISEEGEFENTPYLFDKIISLRNKYPILYTKAVGLEYIYFALINKVYNDKKIRDSNTTKRILERILENKLHISKYMNNLEILPDKLISNRNKSFLISDYFELLNIG